MSALPWSKFYWRDWSSDPGLRRCSLAARGLWIDLLAIAAQNEPRGFVGVAGHALDAAGIAQMIGASRPEVTRLLAELEQNRVFSRDRRGCIYSRRMVKDARAQEDARRNGKLGGNPNLRKASENLGSLNHHVKADVKGSPKLKSPEARERRADQHRSAPSLSGSKSSVAASPESWTGPPEVLAEIVDHAQLGEDWARAWLLPAQYLAGEQALICRSPTAAARLRQAPAGKILRKHGLTVRAAAAH